MSKKQIKILLDFVAFIFWGILRKQEFSWILGNLGHDIGGLFNDEKNFSPRSSDYSKANPGLLTDLSGAGRAGFEYKLNPDDPGNGS